MKVLRRLMELPLSRLMSKSKKNKKKGIVPILVGEEGKQLKRMEVPISCLSSKAFQQLLEEYEDHIEAVREGPIQLPCSLDLFQKVLSISAAVKVEDHNNAKHCMTFSCLASKD